MCNWDKAAAGLFPIDQDGTGTAIARITTDLGAGEAVILPQNIRHAFKRVARIGMGLSVETEVHLQFVV